MNFKSKDYEFSVAPRVIVIISLIIAAIFGIDVALP